MADEATGIFAGFKAGSAFDIRPADGAGLVARVEDLEFVPGDESHRPMFRGQIELRTFAPSPRARTVPINDDGTVTISGSVKHFPPIEE